MVAPHTFTDD